MNAKALGGEPNPVLNTGLDLKRKMILKSVLILPFSTWRRNSTRIFRDFRKDLSIDSAIRTLRSGLRENPLRGERAG
jgi:hypothetical protein